MRRAISAYKVLRNLLSDNVDAEAGTEFDSCCLGISLLGVLLLGVSLLGVDEGDDDAPLSGDSCAGTVLTEGATVCATAVAVSTMKIINEDAKEF